MIVYSKWVTLRRIEAQIGLFETNREELLSSIGTTENELVMTQLETVEKRTQHLYSMLVDIQREYMRALSGYAQLTGQAYEALVA